MGGLEDVLKCIACSSARSNRMNRLACWLDIVREVIPTPPIAKSVEMETEARLIRSTLHSHVCRLYWSVVAF